MKIDAEVEISEIMSKETGCASLDVPVDLDYVEDNEASVIEYIRNELESKFKRPFLERDFIVMNMNEIIEEIKYDEFLDKTEC